MTPDPTIPAAPSGQDWAALKNSWGEARRLLEKAAELLPNTGDVDADERRFARFDEALAAIDFESAHEELKQLGMTMSVPPEFQEALQQAADFLERNRILPGGPAEPEPDPGRCNHCGISYPHEAVFCSACGELLSAGSAADRPR